MAWNFLESHGMPCYMIVLLKLHHMLGMASAEFRLGRVTHSCEGLCQSGDRGMVSRHMSQRKISMKISEFFKKKKTSMECRTQKQILVANQDPG